MSDPTTASAPLRAWPYPDAAELSAALGEWLRDSGEITTFHRRVAANSLGIIEREIGARARIEDSERARAQRLGAESMEALAADIRRGGHDADLSAVITVLTDSVRDRLTVDHPGYAD